MTFCDTSEHLLQCTRFLPLPPVILENSKCIRAKLYSTRVDQLEEVRRVFQQLENGQFIKIVTAKSMDASMDDISSTKGRLLGESR